MSCCIRGCWSRYGKDKVSFHRIPQNNEERRKRWIDIVNRGDQINYNSAMICSRHFVGGWPAKVHDKAAINWVPTLFLGGSDDSKTAGSTEAAANAPIQEIDGDSADIHCLVRGCGMSKDENPSLLFFPISRDQEERAKWLRQIGIHNDPSLMKTDKVLAVCELHFELSKDLLNYDDVISFGRTAVLKEQVKPTRNIPLLVEPKTEIQENDHTEPVDNHSINTDVSFLLQEMNRNKEENNSDLLDQYPQHLQTNPILEEYVQVCRSCLSTNITNLVSAFEDNLNEIFYQFTSLTIDESAGISTMICLDCKQRLLEMHFFRDNCITSTQILFHRQQKAYGSSTAQQAAIEDDEDDLLVPMHESHHSTDYTANGSSFNESLQADDPEDLLMPQKEELTTVNTPTTNRNNTRPKVTPPKAPKAPQQPVKSMKKRFKCKICHKEYNSKGGIEMHMSSHEGDNPTEFTIECARCHVLRRPGDKHSCLVETMYCHVCGDKFRSWSYLKIHLAKTHRIKTKRRELLQKLADDKHVGVTSRLLKAPPIRTVVVPQPQTVPDPDPAEVSSESQESTITPTNKMQRCSFCSARFKHSASLEVHMRSHSAVHQTQCHECGENFATYRKLEKHFDKHPNEILGAMYKCAMCGNIYSRRQTLLMHRQYVHQDREVVQCGGCSKLYAHTRQLADHKCFPKRQEPTPAPAVATTSTSESAINGDFVIVRPESILKGAYTDVIDADEDSSPPVAMQEGNADPLLGLGNEEVIDLGSDDESIPEPASYNCTVCDKTFDKSDVLDRHMKLHRMMNAAKANEIGHRK
ncbi:zinc finger protein 354A-like [Sabethes cyaneus]|uniref:zinc finger protein 354A-like n=1 Tax=Sabethes cyaneus TaxID=53552 RepID=UPI00237E398C|nr:zinc finger protein 354A-like [Sabethes cyaneus]